MSVVDEDPATVVAFDRLRLPYRSTRLADVEAEEVRWLWPARMPLGKIVTLDGDPSVGKSTLAVDLVARITTGQPMPGEDWPCVPASDVVLMSAEDGLADTIRPRLDAAGADVERVHHFDAVPVYDSEGKVSAWVPPTLPDNLSALEELISATGSVLVVVDVLMAYLSGKVDSHRDQDVRRALSQMAEVADRTGACLMALRHLRKSRGSALHSGSGSIAIVGQARAGLVAAHDPEDETGGRRVLAVAKSNLAPMPPALAYALVSDDDRGCGRIEWGGAVAYTADSLLAAPEPGDQHENSDAAQVLAQVLKAGPLWAKQAFDAMNEAGFSKDQTKRAKARLKVATTKVGKPGDAEQGWQWSLPRDRREHEGSEECGAENPLPSLPSLLPSEVIA